MADVKYSQVDLNWRRNGREEEKRFRMKEVLKEKLFNELTVISEYPNFRITGIVQIYCTKSVIANTLHCNLKLTSFGLIYVCLCENGISGY